MWRRDAMKRNRKGIVMKDYSVSCAQMKILEQNTDAAGLSYYQMMENAGTIAANRIVEISMTSPINDAKGGAEAHKTEETAYRNGVTMCKDAVETGGTKSQVDHNSNIAKRQHKYMYMRDYPVRARVYCGKGNNGGDGFVVARLLAQRGWQVDLVLVDGEPTTPDAIENYKLVKGMGLPVRNLAEEQKTDNVSPIGDATSFGDNNPSVNTADGSQKEACYDVIVDAIYGTGFHGTLRPNGAMAAGQIAEARKNGARVFALDIPSGMGGDLTEESELDPRCVRADVTITFHAKKRVHLQPFAEEYCGRIITADIGIVDSERDAFLCRGGDAEKAAVKVMSADGEEAVGVSDGDGPAFASDEPRKFEPDSGEVYSFTDFVEIISRLRAPDGCPWDRKQTHETLKHYLLEETMEAAEAIDHRDDENFCEELGDVLLQIVLNAQIAKERGAFNIDDVIQGISEKMIRRHPWVFGDMEVSTPEEGERLWQEIKKKEKAEKQE